MICMHNINHCDGPRREIPDEITSPIATQEPKR